MDYPSNIASIEDYLKMADMPSEQIIIEARVVEVQLTKEHAFGVNWQLLANEGIKFATMNAYGVDATGAVQNGIWQTLPVNAVKSEPLIGEDQSPFVFGLSNEHLDALIQTLATQMKTDILSAPKISTVNNRRAKIDVLKTVPYLSKVEDQETSTSSSTTRRLIYTYSYADEGVSMDVLPLVNPDGTITLTLCPQVKEIVRWREMVRPSGAAASPELPEIDVRVANTKVTVENGQTIIIGGLIRDKVRHGQTKVPVLGDLPFFGRLFRSDYESKDKTELLIFVCPRLVASAVAKAQTELKTEAKVQLYDFSRIQNMLAALEEKAQKLVSRRKELQDELSGESFN